MIATSGRFALFADCLLVGCLATLASIPLVTAYPALVAACVELRERQVNEHGIGFRPYGRRLIQVLHSGPAPVVIPLVVAAVLALDALAIAAGVPASRMLAGLVMAAASAAAVVGLRAAARWRPGVGWPATGTAAAAEAVRDPGGSALLVLAAAAAAAIVVVVPVTAPLIPGQLALAAVAVVERHRRRLPTPPR